MFDKNALKHKMGKTINIKITVDDDDMKNKTDLAPEVEDSEERGVVTSNEKPEMQMDEPEDTDFGDQVAQSLIDSAPQENLASGKTLDSIARQRAMKRMDFKKGLKG